MNKLFRVGRKFKILTKNDSGDKKEILKPVIIEYVTREGLVEVEIVNGKVKKITNTQTKEIFEREVYNEIEYENPKGL